MAPRKKRRHVGSHRSAPPRRPESPSTDEIVVGLVNSVAVTIGSVYELTDSPLVAVVAGGLAVTVASLALLGFRH